MATDDELRAAAERYRADPAGAVNPATGWRDADTLAHAYLAGQTWSAAPPTVTGWYWWRPSQSELAQPVLVEPLHWSLASRFAVKRSDGYCGTIESIGGEWAGPLLPPGGSAHATE